jgi:hypothetical protein
MTAHSRQAVRTLLLRATGEGTRGRTPVPIGGFFFGAFLKSSSDNAPTKSVKSDSMQ